MADESFDISVVQELLPHRYPFLLVDRVVELEAGKRIVGLKNVTINEPFFQGHFPGQPLMPGVLLLEVMAQVGGLLARKTISGKGKPVVMLTGVEKAKFRKPVVPGDQLRVEVNLVKRRDPFWKMAGKIVIEGALACEAEMTALVSVESEV